jgi:hypothetical protein
MFCLRNISVDTLHKGETEDDDDDNNNNNKLILKLYYLRRKSWATGEHICSYMQKISK